MRARLDFAGWPGGARALAPELFARSERELARQLELLVPLFTPRTVFMDLFPSDCERALAAASYVERVWCIEPAERPGRTPCNLRAGGMGGVPLSSIDVAFSERFDSAHDVRRLLKPGAVWFVDGCLVPRQALQAAGFRRVRYFGGAVRMPAAFARLSRAPVTAACP